MKKVYAFYADGFEEVEALMVIDLLRRTNKIDVVTVSVMDGLSVTGSHNITVMADANISEINFAEGDMIFLPGGMPGTLKLGACDLLMDNVVAYNQCGKKLAAICAAPSLLGERGILEGKKATCYPGFEDKMNGATVGGKVVTDGNITTAKGLGVALELGLELISVLVGEEESAKIANAIQYN